MKITDLYLDELEREAASTRRTLERVPEGQNDWKPHPKSMVLGYLAALVAQMPAWIEMMVNRDELDLNHRLLQNSKHRRSGANALNCWHRWMRRSQKPARRCCIPPTSTSKPPGSFR
jgi:hypothetical protein